MKQTELVKVVAEECEMPQTEVKKVINATLAAIQETLVDGDPVQFVGFGTFDIVKRAARKGRNPATNKEIQIPASKGVKFKVGATLKAAVKGS